MKVRVEHWQAVWERTTAIVDIPDEKLVDEYADPRHGLRDYIEDTWHDWVGDAYIQIEDSVESMDTTLTVQPLEPSKYLYFHGEGT